MHIADPAFSARQDHLTAVFAGHIRNDLSGFGVADHGSCRNLHHQVRAVRAMLPPLSAFFTVLRDILPDVTEIPQCIQAVIHFKDQVAALSAVSAIRAARGHVKLTPERYMSVPAFS